MPDSFYGGKQGYSFILSKSFLSIESMIEKFQLGPAYTDVKYGEYVIINTVDKNDITNGQIFQRGYEYLNSNGGAIYIGTIVGPAGPAPMAEIKTYEAVEHIINNTDKNEYEVRTDEFILSADHGDLVPGADIEQKTYETSIRGIYCNIRDTNGEDTTVHIGLKIPYTIFNFNAKSVRAHFDNALISKDQYAIEYEEVTNPAEDVLTYLLDEDNGKYYVIPHTKYIKIKDDKYIEIPDNEYIKNDDGTYSQVSSQGTHYLLDDYIEIPAEKYIYIVEEERYVKIETIYLKKYSKIINEYILINGEYSEIPEEKYILENDQYKRKDTGTYIKYDNEFYEITTDNHYAQLDNSQDKLLYSNLVLENPPFYQDWTLKIPKGIHGRNIDAIYSDIIDEEEAEIYVQNDNGIYILNNEQYEIIPETKYSLNLIEGELPEYIEDENGTYVLINETYIELKSENRYNLASFIPQKFNISYDATGYENNDDGEKDTKPISEDLQIPYKILYTNNELKARYTNTGPGEETPLGIIDEIQEVLISDKDQFALLVRFNDQYYKAIGNDLENNPKYIKLNDKWYNNLGSVRQKPELLIGKTLTLADLDEMEGATIIEKLNKTYANGDLGFRDDTENQDPLTNYGKSIAIETENKDQSPKQLYAYDFERKTWDYLGMVGAGTATEYINILPVPNETTIVKPTSDLKLHGICFYYEEIN